MFLTKAKIPNPNVKQLKLLMIAQFVMVFAAFVCNVFAVRSIQFLTITCVAANLFFPICYCMQDIIAELCSLKQVIKLVLIAYAVQLAIFGIAALTRLFPVVAGNEALTASFNMVFSFGPRVVLASFTAFLCGSVTNAIVLKTIPNHKVGFKTRAIISTIVGEFFDTWVFLAVLGVSIGWGNALKLALVKTLVEACILPLTSWMKTSIEKAG